MSETLSNQGQQHYYLTNRNYWVSGAYFFTYFFIMATCFPFLGIWLGDINGLSGEDIGLVFSSMSFSAICFQPIFGYLTDKLGIKKHMLWVLAITLLFYAPFFIYVFAPLLKVNVFLGALSGGAYMGFVFKSGAPASEAYIERISRLSRFEYGRARMFGMFGWGICASLAGNLYSSNPNSVFWLGSIAALVLLVLVAMMKPSNSSTSAVIDKLGENKNPVSLKQAFALLKRPQFWALIAYVVGVACTYDIFDQQFGNFFNTFFESKEKGIEMFGYVTTLGETLNAIIMFFVPVIINRFIGAKNALLIAGVIMSIRITGSSFATEAWHVVVLKTLHMFEVPFYLVGLFKYISNVFEVHFSATVYLVACQFIKEVVSMVESPIVGKLYDIHGYQDTYFILGCIAFGFTVLSLFALTGKKLTPEQA
ncbi:MFS transporter [Pasteurella atlantica]|uniref:MFS transporter n=1 Tax=Pasteurellaceae TaxID=712 RepID=UPI002750D38D|nr:MFS transporter [Pasteurella atlantica]MDP8033818.1 MFS transporter [Pasteurella atlantica]MDP8035753.1 MFS transporter [Pasteurella atlantica]MDP8037712.1 MFS transporter [Pasteurella atlantica]MDP8048054.1 MFS transporter [Pasteurella atlantica]MDP8050077.1 MFS transporter [Pasteurella atlantica]